MTSPSSNTSSPAGSATSSVSADVAAGKLPANMPPQLEISTWCTNWDAYDVPRIWSSIKGEDDEDSWKQAAGFENLSELLADHHDRLSILRESLVQSWDPAVSKAAKSFLDYVDRLIAQMRSDAYAHASTARGLHGILDAIKTAKTEVAVSKAKWDVVTTDLLPEWWDHAAIRLNEKAQASMAAMDSSVSDHRKKIIVATPSDLSHRYSEVDGDIDTGTDVTGADGSGDGRAPSAAGDAPPRSMPRWNPPPAVPGRNPVSIPPDSPPLSGGLTPVVPDIDGPPSSLPIPPGNPFVPTGGAYVLPNSTTGQPGTLYPMPLPSAMKDEVAAARALAAREASGRGGGYTPMPVGGGLGQAYRGQDARHPKREGDVQWATLTGVPPVIGEIDAEEQRATQESERISSLNDVFEEWYSSLLTPWDKGEKANLSDGEDRK